MSSIERRIERAEEQLGLDQEPIITRIVLFGGPIPPQERRGNVIVRYVTYESIRPQQEGGTTHEP